MHYLDAASTTAVHPQVAQQVAETMVQHFANPSSLYEPGFASEKAITTAREAVARAMGAGQGRVVFTGGGTEGCNIAVLGAALARRGWGDHLVATGYEHPSVNGPLHFLEKELGFRLTLVPPAADGQIDPDLLLQAVGPKTVLVAAMQTNNETGAALDVAALASAVKAKNSRTAVHVDGVQGFCKPSPFGPLSLAETDIDSYAISGHKLHAPKGVGALYLRKGFNITPPLTGGGQEEGLRPGTENIAYIAGFGRAVGLAAAKLAEAAAVIEALQRRLQEGLEALPDLELNSPPGAQPGIVNFSLPGIRSETMLHFLEQRGVYLSAGSACSRGKPSHTLTAMGLKPKRVTSALRASFDDTNTQGDIDALLEGLAAGLSTLPRGRVGTRRR